MNISRWFVTTVKPQHEASVARFLTVQGIEPFAPTIRVVRQWSDRKMAIDQPLFPGYVFCKFPRTARPMVMKTPGVTSLVGSQGIAAVVPEDEIESVRALATSGTPLQPWPYLERGRQVRIDRGPLKGVDGIIVDLKNECRLVVSVTLLQRSVSVSIDRDLVTPIS